MVREVAERCRPVGAVHIGTGRRQRASNLLGLLCKPQRLGLTPVVARSEEQRAGQERRSRWAPYHSNSNKRASNLLGLLCKPQRLGLPPVVARSARYTSGRAAASARRISSACCATRRGWA